MALAIHTVTLTNGARLGICPLPGRSGDGLRDIGAVLRWQPDLVISMTEQSEMERHNMGDLEGLLLAASIPWLHFPIRDFGAPDAGADWKTVSDRAHAILDRGGAVLAHCYGGQGRSGMVLLRLMVERGQSSETALSDLRRKRPGAVETDAQFAWAAAGDPKA